MKKKPFRFKESFYSFLGGVVASLASTIIYDAIDCIGNISTSVLAYVLLWAAGLLMILSCVFLLTVSFYLGKIEAKYNTMIDGKKDPDETWFRSIRALSEIKVLRKSQNLKPGDVDRLVQKESDKIYWRLFIFLVLGLCTFLLAFIVLILSKVI